MEFSKGGLIVAGRKGADFVDPAGDTGCSVGRPGLEPGLGEADLEHLLPFFQCSRRIVKRDRAGAADGDGLDILGAEDRSHPGSSGLPSKIVMDARKDDPPFSTRSHCDDLVVFSQPLLKQLLGLDGADARQTLVFHQIDSIIADHQGGKLSSPPLEHQAIVACIFQGRSEMTTHIAISITAGGRRKGAEMGLPAARQKMTAQGAGGYYHQIFRTQGIDPHGQHIVEQAGDEAAPSQIFFSQLPGNILCAMVSTAKIVFQYLAGVTM